MKCVKCGYCCKQLMVMIVDDPSKGISEDNIIFHDGSKPCKHLIGSEPGKYVCAIHDMPWYDETPCASHNSELFNDIDCKLGLHIISDYNKKGI